MKKSNLMLTLLLSMSVASNALAEEESGYISLSKESDIKATKADAEKAADEKAEKKLDQFGFGPAFYIINYRDEVLSDSKDVSVRGDGAITTKGTKYSTSFGLELHYDFSFARSVRCFKTVDQCKNVANYELTTAHRLSPFLGLFDVDNGINGIAVGLVYGYIKQHKDDKNPVTLNTGLGWTVHKDRLVLGDGVTKGATPPAGLNVEDYTARKDVKGMVLMISVNMGF
ncbi:MAG: hypothetical protein L3J46_11460 [Kangiellaceae bacterium]|nr:hypothetical protein [Kangiellaceae bacterium]